MDLFVHILTPSLSDKNTLLFLVEEMQLSHGKFYDLLLIRKWEVTETFLNL